MKPAFALDTDAFVFLHALELLEPIGQLAAAGKLELHLTGLIARELSTLQTILQRFEATGGLMIHKVRSKDQAFALYRRLCERGRARSGKPVHKGESELVAWLSTHGNDIVLVSCDQGARDLAGDHRIDALDLCNLACELVRLALLPAETVARQLAVWDDPYAGRGRPKDFAGFEQELSRWLAHKA